MYIANILRIFLFKRGHHKMSTKNICKYSPPKNSAKRQIPNNRSDKYAPPQSSNTNITIQANPSTKKEAPNSNRYQSNMKMKSSQNKTSLNSYQRPKNKLLQIDFNYKNPNNLNFKEFEPEKNLFYFFIIEQKEPTLAKIRNRNTNQFGLYDAEDIQRYRYYPETKQIFTFIGFSDSNKREEAKSTKNLRYSSYEELIFNYPYKIEVESDIFTPNKDLYYFYNFEHRQNFGKIHCVNTTIFKIKCQDFQRGYKLNNEDSNTYRFFGFKDRETRNAMLKRHYDHEIKHSNRDFLSSSHFVYLHEEDIEDERNFIELVKKEREEKRKEKKDNECEKSDQRDENDQKDGNDQRDENDQKEIDDDDDDDDDDENDPKDGIDFDDDDENDQKDGNDQRDENDQKEIDDDDDDDDDDENDPKDGIDFDDDDENNQKEIDDDDDDDDDDDENDPKDGIDFDDDDENEDEK